MSKVTINWDLLHFKNATRSINQKEKNMKPIIVDPYTGKTLFFLDGNQLVCNEEYDSVKVVAPLLNLLNSVLPVEKARQKESLVYAYAIIKGYSEGKPLNEEYIKTFLQLTQPIFGVNY